MISHSATACAQGSGNTLFDDQKDSSPTGSGVFLGASTREQQLDEDMLFMSGAGSSERLTPPSFSSLSSSECLGDDWNNSLFSPDIESLENIGDDQELSETVQYTQESHDHTYAKKYTSTSPVCSESVKVKRKSGNVTNSEQKKKNYAAVKRWRQKKQEENQKWALEITCLTKQNADLMAKNTELNNQLVPLQVKNFQLTNRLSSLKDSLRLSLPTKQNADLIAKNTEQEKQIVALQKRNAQLNDKLGSYLGEYQSSLTKYKARFMNLERALKDCNEKRDELQCTISRQETQIAELKNSLEKRNAELALLSQGAACKGTPEASKVVEPHQYHLRKRNK